MSFGFGDDDYTPDLAFLVDQLVWTTDHVRRLVVAAEGAWWTDADGLTTCGDTIDAVIIGGQSVGLLHAMEALDREQYQDYLANGGMGL